MSKFSCKRCSASINVCTDDTYVTFEGEIYCCKFCKNNRYIPKVLARKNNNKKKKLDRVFICIVKDHVEYYNARDLYKFKQYGLEVQIYLDIDVLRKDRFFLLNYKTSIAKNIVYYGEHEHDKEKIEEILYRRNYE